MSSDVRDLLQSSLGAGYRLSRELGGGGMAKVYVADDPVLGRRVVVKLLAPDLVAGVNVERFKREMRVAVSLHHPRIVPVLSAGQSGDALLYYTMPFIEGETLRGLIERERQLPLDRALAIASDVAEALQYAHGQNIVHRDIKPENILIDAASGRALVTDFGIARAIERAADLTSVTSTGLTLGTPTYMSPEQAAAETHIDGRSDIYSLGCVLYEMLAGAPPFTGPTARAIIARHLTEPPPPIRVVRPDLSEGIAHLVGRMLAKVPAGRFTNADDLLRALDAPERVTPPAILRPRLTRTRAVVIVAAAVVAVAAAAAVYSRSGSATTGTSAPDPANIAVLYFDTPPQDTQLTTIGRGLTRDLIYALERVPDLRLTSEAGIRKFSAHAPIDSVARALDVGTVVLGSLERYADSMQVDVRLADSRSLVEKGAVRGRYALAMVPRMRDTVVREVARQLLARIGKELRVRDWIASTHSSRAWQLRQRAEDLMESESELPLNPADFSPHITLLAGAESTLVLSAAADRDWAEPVIARGWAMLRRAHYAPNERRRAVLDSAAALADASVNRWVGNASALELRGYLAYQRWTGVPGGNPTLGDSAEADLRRATALDPHLARAWGALNYVLELKGDTVGALAAAHRALEVDPYEREAGTTMMRLVFHNLYERKYDSARALCATARARFPNDAYVQSCELSVLGWSGRGVADIERTRRALERTERMGNWPLVAGVWPTGRYWLGAVYARSGNVDSARAVLEDTRNRLRGAGRPDEGELAEAQLYTLLGDQDRALEQLEHLVAHNPASRSQIARYPWFDPLRGSARFVRLISPPRSP